MAAEPLPAPWEPPPPPPAPVPLVTLLGLAPTLLAAGRSVPSWNWTTGH